MKRLLLLFLCAVLLSCAGPLPTISAEDAQGVSTEQPAKSRWHWFHRNKQHHEKSVSAQPAHKSGGWWHHHFAAPAGAGADLQAQTPKAEREKHRNSNNAPLYSIPQTVGGWFHRGPGPAGAGAS